MAVIVTKNRYNYDFINCSTKIKLYIIIYNMMILNVLFIYLKLCLHIYNLYNSITSRH